MGKAVTMTYDALNRQETVKDPMGGVVTTVYDAGSNVVNTVNQLGNTTTHVYDALGRKTKTVDAEGGVITMLWDAMGNQTGLIDPVGNRTTFVYDSLNRKTEEKDPLNKSLTYAYNAAGQLTSQTDRLGRRRDYAFDAGGRMTSETWVAVGGSTANRLTYTYDANGNQLTAADQSGAYTWTYDALNRRATQRDVWNTVLTFGYDGVGNRTLVQDSFGGVLTSVYSGNNLLTSRKFGGSGLTPLRIDLGYTDRNEQAGLTRYSDLAGSTKIGESTFTYDAGGRLTNLQHKDGSNNSLAYYTYTFDAANRVTSEKLNGGSPTSYTYDDTDQLTHDGTKTYSYDANGNRTMVGYATGTANRMTNDGTYTYTYNDEGNLTKKSKGAADETWEYAYDHRNQLTSVEKRATDGGTLVMKGTYTYDVFNQRVQSQEWTSGTGTVTTRYAVLDGNGWADLDGSSALTTRRVFGNRVDQVVARITAGGTAAWYLTDRLGSVRNLVDATGALSATVAYDGFGVMTTDSAPAVSDAYGFTGLTRSRNVGNWQADYRELMATGYWQTEDSSRWDGGLFNLYGYVGNNPTNATDPSGRIGVTLGGGADAEIHLIIIHIGVSATATGGISTTGISGGIGVSGGVHLGPGIGAGVGVHGTITNADDVGHVVNGSQTDLGAELGPVDAVGHVSPQYTGGSLSGGYGAAVGAYVGTTHSTGVSGMLPWSTIAAPPYALWRYVTGRGSQSQPPP